MEGDSVDLGLGMFCIILANICIHSKEVSRYLYVFSEVALHFPTAEMSSSIV